jgi:hypothetical protein
MSKPVARVVVSALIAMALLIGIYTTVLGARNEQAQVGAGLNLSLDRNRITVDGADSSAAPSDALQNKGEGGCDHEAQFEEYD